MVAEAMAFVSYRNWKGHFVSYSIIGGRTLCATTDDLTGLYGLCLKRGDIQIYVPQGEGTAGVDISIILIRKAAPVHSSGYVHIAGDKPGMAPAAHAAAAVGRGSYASTLHGYQQGFICPAGDGMNFVADTYRQLVYAVNIAGVLRVLFRVAVFAEQLVPHELAAEA